MALNGVVKTNSYEGRYIQLEWTATQSIDKNTSTLSWVLKGGGDGLVAWYMAGGFKVSIDDQVVYSVPLDTRIKLYKDTIVQTGTYTLLHNESGQKKFNVKIEAAIYYWEINCRGEAAFVLNDIPRGSTINTTNLTLNKNLSIQVKKASENFSHEIYFICGKLKEKVCNRITDTTISWTPPINLATQIVANTTGVGSFIIKTYNGNTFITEKTQQVVVFIPEYVVPTIGEVVVKKINNDVPSSWNLFIQGKSQGEVTINEPMGAYGSTIKSYTIKQNGNTISSEKSTTTKVFNEVGTIVFEATIIDTRGRKATKSININVVEYITPTIITTKSLRCLKNGVLDDDGEYIKAYIDYTYATCLWKNNATCTVAFRKVGEAIWSTEVPISDQGYKILGVADVDSTYEVRYTLSDTFAKAIFVDIVSTAFTSVDFRKGGKGIAIGKVSEKDYLLELSDKWEFKVYGHNLKEYIRDSIYPVGSVYISVNAVSPSTLFGGEWVQIKDRFLLSAGNTNINGRIGGSETHRLTERELPSHKHVMYGHTWSWGTKGLTNEVYATAQAVGGDNFNGNNLVTSQAIYDKTLNTGGGQAFSIMPPYLVVYMWKRVK